MCQLESPDKTSDTPVVIRDKAERLWSSPYLADTPVWSGGTDQGAKVCTLQNEWKPDETPRHSARHLPCQSPADISSVVPQAGLRIWELDVWLRGTDAAESPNVLAGM